MLKLTQKAKRYIQRSYRTKRGQARVKRLWQSARDAWHWLEDYGDYPLTPRNP